MRGEDPGTRPPDAATHHTTDSGPASGRERSQTRNLEQVFDEILAPERERLLAYLFGMCGERETALDLTQETYLAAWRGLAGFRGESAPLTWLIGIARRVFRRWARREGRRARLLSGAGGLRAGIAAASDAAADTALASTQQAARVREAIGALAPERREAIVLHYFVGLPIAEVARVTQTNAGTVKSRLARGREALARTLRDVLGE